MSSLRAFCYSVYPGSSARFFPKIQTVIFVNPEALKQWKSDETSINFNEVISDPSEPVKVIWTDYSGYKGYIGNHPNLNEALQTWYQTTDRMEIAKQTARNGYDVTDKLERMTTPKTA